MIVGGLTEIFLAALDRCQPWRAKRRIRRYTILQVGKKRVKRIWPLPSRNAPRPRCGAKASSNSSSTCAGISNTSRVCWNMGPKASPFLYLVGYCIAIGSSSTCMRSNGTCISIVTTHPYQRRAVPKRPFEWRPADCIPDLPWSAGNGKCGNRPRRAFLSGSTQTPSV